jgi:predicted ribosome quality control (RQC) complex YloA/Tae2 family protein
MHLEIFKEVAKLLNAHEFFFFFFFSDSFKEVAKLLQKKEKKEKKKLPKKLTKACILFLWCYIAICI